VSDLTQTIVRFAGSLLRPRPVWGGCVDDLAVRKRVTFVEDVLTEGGSGDAGGVLRRVAVGAVIANPYARPRAWSADLSELVEPSTALAQSLAAAALHALGDLPLASFGKGAIVGLDGEQEHAVACITSAFGDPLRAAIGGGKAWLPSTTKRAPAGTSIDLPTAYRHALWVRSHYDTVTFAVQDAPLPDEILVCLAVCSRGRIHQRLGGLAEGDVVGEDGLR
jgi:hypothetical protein